jgi:hypothetical protein
MKYTFLLFIALTATSCGFNRIGSLTMASSRNIERSAPYELLRRNVEGVSKLKEDEALNEAMDDAVLKVPGGEYLMNVVIKVSGRKVKVIGDVYGIPPRLNPNVNDDKILGLLPGDPITIIDAKGRRIKGHFTRFEGSNVYMRSNLGKEFCVPITSIR